MLLDIESALRQSELPGSVTDGFPMDQRERRAAYEAAMQRMDEHIVRGPDGLFVLQLGGPAEIDVDPIVFADLKRSLEETNKKIKAGEIEL